MAWLFVPGLVASNSDSTSPNPDTELWVGLSGKHEQPTPTRGMDDKTTHRMRDGHQNSLKAAAVSAFPPFLQGETSTTDGGPNTKSTPTHTGGMDLEGAVAMWATPSVADVTGGHMTRGGVRSGELLLPGQAAIHWWATPAARSTKGGYSEEALTRQDGKSRMDILDNQAIYFPPFLQGETSTTDGEPSSPSTRGSRRLLNPDFVEWLMGWPIGWTVPGSPLPETEWSRWWQHMRGSLYELGWR